MVPSQYGYPRCRSIERSVKQSEERLAVKDVERQQSEERIEAAADKLTVQTCLQSDLESKISKKEEESRKLETEIASIEAQLEVLREEPDDAGLPAGSRGAGGGSFFLDEFLLTR